MKIITNQAKCKICGDLVISTNLNDYNYCACGAIAVGGGNQAILRLGHHNHILELSVKEYSD
ncbi:MAG: hypothetical protein JXR88_14905 [Clostridia bacterium]|nr:hypothetical protein [Clostridia bacterium]